LVEKFMAAGMFLDDDFLGGIFRIDDDARDVPTVSCGHEWSVPASPAMRPIPETELPRKRRWFRKRS
jgi:hypothetical protein